MMSRVKITENKEFPPALIEIRCSLMLKGEIGLFALRNLKKGTIVGHDKRFNEIFFTWDQYAKLDKQTKKMVDKFCASTKDGFWGPDNINYLHSAWHMNHSCNGNIGFDEEDNFVTIRHVLAGEELLFDYGLLISNPEFKLKCNCGSPDCRGIITGNDWQNNSFIKNNLCFMSHAIRTLCLKLNGIEK